MSTMKFAIILILTAFNSGHSFDFEDDSTGCASLHVPEKSFSLSYKPEKVIVGTDPSTGGLEIKTDDPHQMKIGIDSSIFLIHSI